MSRNLAYTDVERDSFVTDPMRFRAEIKSAGASPSVWAPIDATQPDGSFVIDRDEVFAGDPILAAIEALRLLVVERGWKIVLPPAAFRLATSAVANTPRIAASVTVDATRITCTKTGGEVVIGA